MKERYSSNQFHAAYERWRKTQRLVMDLAGLSFQERQACLAIRNSAWDEYCDIRDGLRPGTNKARRLRLAEISDSESNVVPLKA